MRCKIGLIILAYILPTKAELKRRHVEKESYRDLCGDSMEDLFHVAIICPHAKSFWNRLRKITGRKLPLLHPCTWTTDILSGKRCSIEDAAFFVCGVWALWTGRNNRRHGRDYWYSMAIAKHVASMIEVFLCMEASKAQRKPAHTASWMPPEHGWVKEVNTDASYHVSSNSGAAGCVIRDSYGKIMAVEARWHNHVSDVLTMEALAARDGLLLAVAHGYRRLILESDSLSLVNQLNSSAGSRSPIAGLWHEIQELGKTCLCFKVVFVPREANAVAHSCAAWVS